jgi:FKBP-type peptidyl-prolyl cis-trans isomerase
MNFLDKKKISVLMICFGLIFLCSCKKEDPQAKTERENLQAFITNYNITVQPTSSGLYYIELITGTGAFPKVGQTATVHYTGYYLNGNVFDSSLNSGRPFSFVIGAGTVIRAWDEAILLMKKGGKARIIAPSGLAYGQTGYGYTIPPYTTLIFDISLIDIK